MSTRAENVEAELSELTALRQAVARMGFDPKLLAAYIADPSDHTCKSILLSSLSLDASKLGMVQKPRILMNNRGAETGPA